MAATITYAGAANGQNGTPNPVRSGVESLELHIVKFVPDSSYAAGGEAYTTPSEIAGKKLAFISVLTVMGTDVDGNVLYDWNGSTTAPKITATVPSTGAEASGDLSNDVVWLLCGYSN